MYSTWQRVVTPVLALALAACGSSAESETSAETGSDSGSAAGDEIGTETETETSAEDESGSGETDAGTETDSETETTATPGLEGEFSFLTYNVAGLPEGVSSSHPEANTPQISPLLNAYDLVLVQEDFWYHEELSADAEHPYQSQPWSEEPSLVDMGDGLNRFSIFPFELHEREAWYDCNGTLDCASDCLATKGWSFARTTFEAGVVVDVYNLHMEAGSCEEDLVIRDQAAMDLVSAIAIRSEGRPVIVAGDFNLRTTDPEDVFALDTIKSGAGLADACEVLDCGDARIDQVLYRGSESLLLEAQQWWIPPEFVTEDEEDLSDHLPVAVRLRYETL
ncbi:endonuclease/exonuclease/phosphatase family protein [Pseudenhygromyxa sp. WMMC2535]|uniref:endonuclease/exonuclease/phosphatase family protein n=1 Tax=Pseudenhygromyxa sp. WMMC2535 TaxID=2712867 RepID=UPI0015537017|nr:endonuclease/exonuclease/phosphatase family protein [Pseudenhygromyxa sp. WMMC2535]NVB41275.1 endonuclease/exonuclease/phosphatase family protein [Pseudenhygromyxa sp. WMMC2535]